MRKTGLAFIAGITLAAALATVFGVWHDGHPAGADPFLMVGIDMDAAGNSCPGTGTADCTLGAIDQCVSVSAAAGTTFTIDVFVTGLTNGFEAWNDNIEFPDASSAAKLTMSGQTETDPLVNILVQSPGSSPVPSSAEVPDTETPHNAAVGEFGTVETTPPFTQGVLGRYTFTVGAGAAPGVYDLTLDPSILTVTQGEPRDIPGIPYAIDAIVNGKVALDQECPPSPPLPTATPGASPTPSTSVTPMPTGTPPAGGVTLVAGWNDACYPGQAQAIEDAFASVADRVEAVYRMRPDQTFERWFATRPEVSTIETVSPFDQLFILSSSDATLTIQTAAQPPSSLPLISGWNSVCYLGGGEDTPMATAGISGTYSIIYSLPQDQVWRRYVPGQPELSTLARLETLTSVLVLMTEEGTWAFSP